MLSKENKKELRGRLFRHLDGIVTAPIAYALHQKGLTSFLLEKKRVELKTLVHQFKANDGYLNVALRMLCSQGWLIQEVDNASDEVVFQVNDKSAIAFAKFNAYESAAQLLKISENYHPRKFEKAPFLAMEKLFAEYSSGLQLKDHGDEMERKINAQILRHVEGVLFGPTMVQLGMSGMFHKYFMETRFKAEEFHQNPKDFGRLLDILVEMKWFQKSNDTYEFTDEGLFFARRASAYGVTVSYIPTLRKAEELIFGNPKILKTGLPGEDEKHVDREMNVWGSGGAHSTYFKVIDEIIISIFNKPIQEQPKGILDMGCGNGAFLSHIFNLIETQTLRGTLLDEHPLNVIGVDYNQAALNVSKANLIKNEIWAKVIWGDIGDPDRLASDLKAQYGIELSELLNVRTFLDHNRVWEEPVSKENIRKSQSSGAYAFEGKRLNNNLVTESLRLHFEKWSPYVSKHGLILIELHTVKPELVANNLGRTPATAYDATHGFSDQYILEVEEFLEVIRQTGLEPVQEKFRKFPESDLATVTINLFKANS